MNKREQRAIEEIVEHRLRMKNVLIRAGFTISGNESTEYLEELVVVICAPPVEQFSGLVCRAEEAME